MVQCTTRAEGDPGSNPALDKQWSRDYLDEVSASPTLPDANLRYQDALDWLTMDKRRKLDLLSSAQF